MHCQAGALEETVSSTAEMTSTIRQNAENALQASQFAGHACAVARKGGQVMAQVVGTMGDISASSLCIIDIIGIIDIIDIIAVIDGIAFQTNILALNAAVERHARANTDAALRRSPAKYGFAQRAATAAKEVRELIDDSEKKVNTGSQLVAQAGHTIADIVASVDRHHG